MAEVILTNNADFTGTYDSESIVFSSNTVSTRIVSGLEATKTANKEVWVNGPLVYTIVVTNTSGETLEGAVFTDTLNALIVLDETADVTVNGTVATYTYASNVLTINLGDLADGETRTITFQVLQA